MLFGGNEDYPNAYMLFYEKINKVNCLDYDDIDVIENKKKLNFNDSNISLKKIKTNESNIDIIHNLDNDDISSNTYEENNDFNDIYSNNSTFINNDIKKDNIFETNNYEDFLQYFNNINLNNNNEDNKTNLICIDGNKNLSKNTSNKIIKKDNILVEKLLSNKKPRKRKNADSCSKKSDSFKKCKKKIKYPKK